MADACPTCAGDTTLRECPDCHRSPQLVWVERLSRWVRLGGGATIAMTLAACYGPPQTDGGAARMPEADPTTTPAGAGRDDLAHSEKIGGLTLGMKAQAVLTTLGEPGKRAEPVSAEGVARQRWEYSDRGVAITMIDGADGQTIESVELRAPATLATSRGIKIGSSRADVEKAYAAERDAAASDANKLVAGGIVFGFEGDSVSSIVVGP